MQLQQPKDRSSLPRALVPLTRHCYSFWYNGMSYQVVCVPRPYWDFRLEHKGEDDEDEGADSHAEEVDWDVERSQERLGWSLLREFPDYTWKVYWTYSTIVPLDDTKYATAVLKGAKAEQEIQPSDLEEGSRLILDAHLQRLHRNDCRRSFRPAVCIYKESHLTSQAQSLRIVVHDGIFTWVVQ